MGIKNKYIDKNKIELISIICIISLITTLFVYQWCINLNFNNNETILFCIFSFIFTIDILAVIDLIPKKIYKILSQNKIPLISVILSATIILLTYIVYGVEPFGNNTVIKVDMFSQYAPLHMQLYDKITNFDFSFYNWNTGGGTPFFGDFFNYLASPYTVLMFLFPKEEVSLAFSLIVLAKLVSAAFTFTYYLKQSLKLNKPIYALFGVVYSLSGYITSYYWNIMWLDAVIVLPLMILGIERIIDKQDGRLYVFSLIYGIYANYYMGFMLCVTSVIYFIFYLIKTTPFHDLPQKLKSNETHKTFKLYSLLSALSGGVLAAILIPLFLLLKNSDATAGDFVDFTHFNFNPFQFFAGHLSLTEPTIILSYAGNSPLPNVFITIPLLILVGLFFVNKKINIKDKVLFFFFFVFFYISFAYEPLDYVWHAFHFTNDIPYRNAYIYTFFLVVVAAISLKNIKYITLRRFVFCVSVITTLSIISFLAEDKFKLYALIVTLIVVLFSVITYMIYRSSKLNKYAVYLMYLTIICDLIITSVVYFNFSIKTDDYIGDYDSITNAVKYIEENDGDNTDYRVEFTNSIYGTEGNIYNLKSVSGFSSMANAEYSNFWYKLGMKGNGANKQTHTTSTPVLDLLTSTKYIIVDDTGEDKISDYFYEKYYSSDNITVYRNKYYIPIGIVDNQNSFTTDEIINEKNPFIAQNKLIENHLSVRDLFVNTEIANIKSENIRVERSGCVYNISKLNDSETQNNYVDFLIDIQKDGPLYIDLGGDFGSNNTTWDNFMPKVTIVDAKGVVFFERRILLNQIYYIDDFKAGDKITIHFDFCNYDESLSFSEGKIIVRGVASLDINKFEQCYKSLLARSVEISTDKNSLIIYTNNTTGQIHTNIPYDKGWKVVDKSDATVINNNGFLTINIPSKNTQVELSYTPFGLYEGLTLSVISIIILLKFLKKENYNIK